MRRLGSGGFGVVFEAFDRERGSPVALKTLRRVEPEALYRFKQEFRALVDIAHPNLAALYELMSAEGQWFFTMELIRGVNFLDYVTDRFPSIDAESPDDGFPSPFPLAGAGAPSDADATTMNLEFDAEAMASLAAPPSLLGIRRPASQTDRLREGLRQVAEGLRALHDSGRLHRDIKPSNVLVTRDGRVKIVDFGLVADLGADGPESTVQIVGTPAYMAPEQAAMRPVSPASDWYSVGVLLFEALTGRLPFEGSSLEVLALKQVDKPPEPARFSPEAPEDLNALCRDLLRLDPSRRPSAMQVLSRLAGGPHPTVPPGAARRVLPLLGRREHLSRLQEALEESRRSHAVTILVHGRSGTGKSALLRHFFHEIPRREPSAVVLSGRCYQQESVPYKALDSLIDGLSQYLKSLPPRECEEFLPREGLALARVFPVLLQVPAVAAAKRQVPEIPDSRELRRRAIEALRDLLSRIASRNPLVLAIDDLQWGDLDSASLLAQLLAPPAAPKLLLIAAYRSEDLGSSAILKLLSSREPFPGSAADVREIAVGDLDFADARTLAAMLLGEIGRDTPETAAAIARESGGNPFFIQELARAVRADTAPRPRGESGGEPAATSLDALIRERVERLAPESRRLLEIVSVAGAPLPREVAKRAAALGEEEQAALGPLKAGHLVRATGLAAAEEIETYHDRIRETVVGHLDEESLRSRHKSLAFAMESSGRADPERLAVHFQSSGDPLRAAGYAVEAASRASEALAFDRAARLYRLALELRPPHEPGNSDLQIRLGDALSNAGRGAQAAQAYLAAARGAVPGQSLELQRRAAEQFLRSGHLEEGLSTIREVLEAVGMRLSKTRRRALTQVAALRLRIKLRGLKFREREESKVPALHLMRIDTCWSVAIGLGFVDTLRGAVFQSRGLLLALRAGEPYRVARALAVETAYSSSAGGRSRERTRKLAKAALEIAGRLQHPHSLGLATAAAGIAAYFEGQWGKARDLLERGEKILRERCTGVAFELDNAVYCDLFALFFLGEVRELCERLPPFLQDADERGDLYSATNLRLRVAYLAHLAAGRTSDAERELDIALESWPHRAYLNQHWWNLLGRAQIRLYLGQSVEAWELLTKRWPDLDRSLVARIQLIFLLSRHLRARCAIAAAASGGQSGSLLRAAETDAADMEKEKMPWADPLALLLRAGIAAVRGDPGSALQKLSLAETGLEAGGMRLHAAAARRRRGELLGGEEGAAIREAADSWMLGQGISAPERMAAMLAPGKWLRK